MRRLSPENFTLWGHYFIKQVTVWGLSAAEIGLWWNTHMWPLPRMGVVRTSEHSKVEVRCHQRRAYGNWHPHHPCPRAIEVGTILVESNLAWSMGNHQRTPTLWLIPLLGFYSKKIIQKKKKVIHKVSQEYCFLTAKKWNCINQKLASFFCKG